MRLCHSNVRRDAGSTRAAASAGSAWRPVSTQSLTASRYAVRRETSRLMLRRQRARCTIHQPEMVGGAGVLRRADDAPRFIDPHRLRNIHHAIQVGNAVLSIDQAPIGRVCCHTGKSKRQPHQEAQAQRNTFFPRNADASIAHLDTSKPSSTRPSRTARSSGARSRRTCSSRSTPSTWAPAARYTATRTWPTTGGSGSAPFARATSTSWARPTSSGRSTRALPACPSTCRWTSTCSTPHSPPAPAPRRRAARPAGNCCASCAGASLHLVGADVVEVAPAYDHAEVTALAAATVIFDIITLIARVRG